MTPRLRMPVAIVFVQKTESVEARSNEVVVGVDGADYLICWPRVDNTRGNRLDSERRADVCDLDYADDANVPDHDASFCT